VKKPNLYEDIEGEESNDNDKEIKNSIFGAEKHGTHFATDHTATHIRDVPAWAALATPHHKAESPRRA
jgi:hypothetical protein